MGWTGVYKSLADTKKMILDEMNFAGSKYRSEVLKNATYGREFWILRKLTVLETGLEFITATFVFISHNKGETTYKEIDIDTHPYYYNCPSSWLDLIAPQGDMGREWLETARNVLNRKNLEIVSGMKFNFNNAEYTTVEKYSSHFWRVRRNDGMTFKIKTTLIKESLTKHG